MIQGQRQNAVLHTNPMHINAGVLCDTIEKSLQRIPPDGAARRIRRNSSHDAAGKPAQRKTGSHDAAGKPAQLGTDIHGATGARRIRSPAVMALLENRQKL